MALTEKQQRFLDAYKQLMNGPQAAISAGYAAKSAAVEANRLLKHPAILLELDNWRKQAQKTLSKDDFISYALKDYQETPLCEANRPRFLQLAGQGAGIIGTQQENKVVNNTLNIQVNNNDTRALTESELWEQTRQLLG